MSGGNTSPPITLSEQRQVRMPLLVLLAILSASTAATLAWASLRNDVTSANLQLLTQEERVKRLEDSQADIAVMRNDLRWIRTTLERQDRRTP